MIIFFTRHVRTLHTVIWLRMSCIMVSWYSCTCFVRGERRRNMTSAGWMTRRAGSGTVKEQLRRRQRTAGAAAAGCCDQGEDTSGATRDTRARRHKRSRRRHTCLTCCLISSLVALDDDISSGRRPGGPTGEFEGGRLTPALSSLSPLTGLYFGGNTRGKKFPSQTGLNGSEGCGAPDKHPSFMSHRGLSNTNHGSPHRPPPSTCPRGSLTSFPSRTSMARRALF